MNMESPFEELKRYVQFDAEDEAALRSLHAILLPELASVAEVIYERILSHEGARTAIERSLVPIERLRQLLVPWMEQLFRGPWDEKYFELRCHIARTHVRIGLPQHYIFGSVNVLRYELGCAIERQGPHQPAALRANRSALARILDLELAIILHTYREEFIAQQSKSERLATFGQLVGSIGHELRAPLSVMSSSLHLIKNRAQHDERMLTHIARIEEQLSISNSIISGLVDILRDEPRLREPVSLRKIVDEALATLTVPSEVTLTTLGIDNLPALRAAPSLLCQALRSVLENALQAVGSTGQVSLRAALQDNRIEIAVSDSGPGVDAAIQERLFEPLVTTRPGRLGLGLTLAKRIIQQHGGAIIHAPQPEKRGARFIIQLPLDRQTEASFDASTTNRL